MSRKRCRAFAFIALACFLIATQAFGLSPLPAPNLQLGNRFGSVWALIPLGDGSVLVGGQFESINGAPRNGLARLNADGSLDLAWNAHLDGSVYTMLVNGAYVYVGGSFSQVGGQPRFGLARVSLADGSLSTGWAADVDGSVRALATDGSDLIVGGSFSTIGGASRTALARVAFADGSPTPWTNDVTANGFQGSVLTLARDGGSLYLGGYFDAVAGQPRHLLARVSLASPNSPDPAWAPTVSNNATISAMAVFGSWVYVGGSFSNIGGIDRTGLARLATASGAAVDASWVPPQPLNSPQALLVDANGVLAAVFAYPSQGLAELDLATGALTSWDPTAGSSWPTTALAFGNGYIWTGQSQPQGDVPSVARFVHGAPADPTFRAYAGSSGGVNVRAIALASDASAYVGGDFHGVEGLPMRNLLRVKPDGTLDNVWRPDPDADVEALALSGSALLVGGQFTHVGGVARNYLAKIATGATADVDPTWNPNPDGSVSQVVVDGTDVYVAGGFSTPRICLAKLQSTGSGSAVIGWDAAMPFPNCLAALAAGGGSVYIAQFNQMWKLSAATGATDPTWFLEPNGTVGELVLAGSDLFAAGLFTEIGGVFQRYLARIDAATGSVDPGWMPQFGSGLTSMSQDGGVLYVSPGQSVNGFLSGSLFAISAATGRPDFTWSACCASAETIRVRNGQVWSGFSNSDYDNSRLGVEAFPIAVCVGVVDGTPCDDGPGVSGAKCQGGICTPEQAATSIALVASPNPVTVGSMVTLTATVTSSGAPAHGAVYFLNDYGQQFCQADLSNNVATCTFRATDGYVADVTAIFPGTAQHLPSRSATVHLTLVTPILTAVKSRKYHGAAGAFDLAIDATQPLDGPVTVEPRQIGTGHTIVFRFDRPIEAPGSFSCVDGAANFVATCEATAFGNEVLVSAWAIPDGRRLQVFLFSVNEGNVQASASVGFLAGDVNNSRFVTASDILRAKGRAGQATDATNFIYDFDANGTVSAPDVSTVKANSGAALNQ